jgi:hypothetical protein
MGKIIVKLALTYISIIHKGKITAHFLWASYFQKKIQKQIKEFIDIVPQKKKKHILKNI